MSVDKPTAGERNDKGQFLKGVSGNPAGRPRTSVAALWRKLNNEVDETDTQGRTRGEVLYHRMFAEALKGNVQAAALIMDRTEGKARQAISVDTDREARRERKIQNYMAESEREGDPMTRAEAVAVLKEEDPDFEDYEE